MQCPFLHRRKITQGSVLVCAAGADEFDMGSRCVNEGYNYCRRYLILLATELNEGDERPSDPPRNALLES